MRPCPMLLKTETRVSIIPCANQGQLASITNAGASIRFHAKTIRAVQNSIDAIMASVQTVARMAIVLLACHAIPGVFAFL